ncbi:MAG: sugar-binding domain-containing protein [Microbacteriaceae bacterium]
MDNQHPVNSPTRIRDALRAANLYYIQDLTMDAIARELRTSRSSISRLLSFARSSGLVDIRISSPLDAPGRLESEFTRRYAVAAQIVSVPDQVSEIDRLERVARSAARILGQYVDSNMTVGIAWGSTVSAISRQLPTKQTYNAQIVQLNGAANSRTTGILYASEILSRFGDAFGAYVQQFPVPAFFDDPETKQALWRERSIRRVLDIQAHMDVAVFGLGSPSAQVPSHVFSGGYLTREDFRALAKQGVVGDVATVFYRVDGSSNDLPLNARSSGPDLALLRRVSRRVCVVSGTAKLASLRGALNAGIVTDLIVDESTARALIESEQ